MNKPNWEDAPLWANWLALDSNGAWWWYQDKPQFSAGLWVVKSYDTNEVDRANPATTDPFIRALAEQYAPDTLEARPQ